MTIRVSLMKGRAAHLLFSQSPRPFSISKRPVLAAPIRCSSNEPNNSQDEDSSSVSENKAINFRGFGDKDDSLSKSSRAEALRQSLGGMSYV